MNKSGKRCKIFQELHTIDLNTQSKFLFFFPRLMGEATPTASSIEEQQTPQKRCPGYDSKLHLMRFQFCGVCCHPFIAITPWSTLYEAVVFIRVR